MNEKNEGAIAQKNWTPELPFWDRIPVGSGANGQGISS
jgi:hypothetical protein